MFTAKVMSFNSRTNRAIWGLAIALIAFLALRKPAYAHIRWFVDQGKHSDVQYPLDLTTMFIIVGAISFAAFAIVVHRANWPRKFHVFQKGYLLFSEGSDWRIVASLAGVLLIVNSITDVFLAPNIVLPGGVPLYLGKVAQMVVGLVLVSQVSFSLAGLLILVVVVPLAAIYVPIASLIDYLFEFTALGLALIIVGVNSCYLDQLACALVKRHPQRVAHLSLPIIRIGLGLTLIVLAIHNKLLDPNLALTFFEENNLNFMPYLGFTGFTDLHFAFAAGVGELTIGLLLVSGIATRFVTGALSIFFIGTLISFGPTELIGHLPLFGITLLLITRGSGSLRLASRLAPVKVASPLVVAHGASTESGGSC